MQVTKLPEFTADNPDTRLAFAHHWVSKHCPGRQLTLEEIGTIMGLTRERVRQIEANALKKLRHPAHLKQLKD